MKKFLIITLLLVSATISAAEMKKDLKISYLKNVPFIIKGINVPVNSNSELKNFVKLNLPEILKINSKVVPEINFSQKIGNITFHRVSYSINGIPVIGAHSVIKQKNGKIFSVINAAENIDVDTKPSITALKASKKVVSNNYAKVPEKPDFLSNLVILKRFGKYRLAWKIRFRPESPIDGRYYYVDAHSGMKLGGGNFVRNADEPTNMAKVFLSNPIRDKEPVEIELPWVADDAEGKLTSVEDEEGIRKIVAANCPVLGDTVEYYNSEYDICTAKQLANKTENGNFIYEDWTKGVDFQKDVEDVYSEVAMYHHMSRIYSKLMSIGLDGFTNIGVHKDKNPIIGIANFQMPTQSGTLSSMDNAFYSPHDPYFAEMFFSEFDYDGDMLVLGQGSKADFAYDGDVIYHEFGHATVEGTAQLAFESSPDKYGYSNETIGLDEGMADTFSFLIAGDSCLGEYVSEAYGESYGYTKTGDYYCLRNAENENMVNEDFTGESHHDGLPAVNAHWQLYQAVLDAGKTTDDFLSFYISALLSVPFSDLKYKGWGDILLDTVEDTDFSALKDKFQEILDGKGFFNEIRARNIEHEAQYLFSGGVAQYPGYPSETIEVEIEGAEMEVAPMYVQLYYDVPDNINTITISGKPTDGQSMSASSAPKYSLLSRKGEPVFWTVDDIPFRVDYDTYIMNSDNSWTVKNLEPGSRYYFQFINTGPSGMLYGPKFTASWISEEISDSDTIEETDEEVNDDNTDSEEDDETDKKESGCSVLVF